MIVKNIRNNACVFVIPGGKPQFTVPGNLVHVSKRVNIAMNQDPFHHLLGKLLIASTLHIVAHEISYNDFLIASREVCMCKKIHPCIRFFEFRKKYSKNSNI